MSFIHPPHATQQPTVHYPVIVIHQKVSGNPLFFHPLVHNVRILFRISDHGQPRHRKQKASFLLLLRTTSLGYGEPQHLHMFKMWPRTRQHKRLARRRDYLSRKRVQESREEGEGGETSWTVLKISIEMPGIFIFIVAEEGYGLIKKNFNKK